MSEHPKGLAAFTDAEVGARFKENQELAARARAATQDLRERERELTELRTKLRIYEALEDQPLHPPEWLVPARRKGEKHLAIPSMMVTDVHYGEDVRPESVDGVNAYGPRIADQRLERAGTKAVRLCRDYMSGTDYEGFNLVLGGDAVSGEIHDELRETNAQTTPESVVGVLECLIALTKMLADEFGKVYIPCVPGNHGRLTKKPRQKKKARDSFDALVYMLMRRELSGDKRITVDISRSGDIHFPVYGTKYCLTHGDQFHGGSGISGWLTPLMLGAHRKRQRDDATGKHWDVMVCGHFHQSFFLPGIVVGGSVIGYNEFAQEGNLPFEEPKASLWLTTPERGITTYNPVHLLDRAKEGW